MCVAGQTSSQKIKWNSRKRRLNTVATMASELEHTSKKDVSPDESWMDVSCPNGLQEIHSFHVKKGKEILDKKLRDVFVNGSIQDIRDDFQVRTYCM